MAEVVEFLKAAGGKFGITSEEALAAQQEELSAWQNEVRDAFKRFHGAKK